MNERELLAVARQLADQYGWARYHTHDSRKSEAGFPDLVLTKAGRGVLFVELKSLRGRLTCEQERWLWLLEEAGHETRVLRCCPDTCPHRPNTAGCAVQWLRWRLGPNGRRSVDVGAIA